MLYVSVLNQEMKKHNNPIIVSDAVNFVQITFNFDDNWDGLNKTYQFTNGPTTIDLESNDTVVNIPPEALISGLLSIKVFGTILDENGETVVKKGTTKPITFEVQASDIINNATNTGDITPTVIDQIRAIG